jgi:ATP-dependent helicase/nuclease subunit A
MNQWTDQQLAAIDSRDTNLLVSAAAGSGKTAVLIERIIRMVLHDQIDIDRLLVVTFTRAAAAEMRERAASALIRSIVEQPEKEPFIRRQLGLLNQSSIMTFHSFCMKIIKNHYYLIDLEPSFRTADQSEAALLQQEAVEETLELYYQIGDSDFIRLIEMYCSNRNDQAVQDMIITLYQYSRSQAEPAAWLSKQAALFDAGAEQLVGSEWLACLMELASVNLEYAHSLYKQSLDLCISPDGPAVYERCLKAEIFETNRLLEMFKQGDPSAIDQIRNIIFDRLPACRCTDLDLRDEAKGYRDLAKKEIKKIQDTWFSRSIEEFAADHLEIAPAIKKLIEIVDRFQVSYQKKKHERNILDFNDLEHMALKILQIPEAGDYYCQQYESIFIDEYQDSNRVQEALIHYIKRVDNLFMVGDVKQSIYRFRLAEPELFMQKYARFAEGRNRLESRIDLNQNFRSRKNILDAVNVIFQKVMTEKVGEIQYDESVFLQYGETYPESIPDEPVSVHLLEKNEDARTGEDGQEDQDSDIRIQLDEWTDLEAEAMLLVNQVNELLKTEIYDAKNKCARQVRYSDITVLLRAPGRQSPRFTEILTNHGIPVYADQGTGFYDTLEVQIFINLLRVIDNFKQDLPLLSVLRSQFGGFTTDELTEIRISSTEKHFHEAFQQMADHDSILAGKVNRFIKKLEDWRRHKRVLSLTEFLWWLLSDSGFYAVSAALPGGRQRQANLRILLNRAADFSANNDGGLFAFLSYIEKLRYNQANDHGPAKTLSENDDVVRIMSIHKSKGLEFPVVILAGLGKQFNRQDNQMPLLMHRTLGLGPFFADPVKRVKRHTLARIALREKSRIESLSEEMRILYVGMTRAQQKLIMIGAVKNLPSKIKQWKQPISQGRMAMAQSALDWLGPVWMRLPSAIKLRNLTDHNLRDSLYPDHNGWNFTIWDRQLLLKEESKKAEQQDQLKETINHRLNHHHDAVMKHLIDKRFLWQYPYQSETEMTGKISVSELLVEQQRIQGTERKPTIPDMILSPRFKENERALTASEKGVAFHYLLQHLDLNRVNSLTEMEAQLKWMKSNDMLTDQESESIDLEAVNIFFMSRLGRRLLNAERVYRELPFVMKKTKTESVLVQGVMDCCFLEQGEWVLIDFKTDVVELADADEWSRRYRTQLDFYEQALLSLTKITVKEKLIYSFHLHRAFPMHDNDEERRDINELRSV